MNKKKEEYKKYFNKFVIFENKDIIHVQGNVDPKRDMETVAIELQLADLQNVENRLSTISRQAKSGDRDAQERLYKNNEQVRETLKERGEQRANATGTGFLPPIYLGDDWAGVPHPGRPFANALPRNFFASGPSVSSPL